MNNYNLKSYIKFLYFQRCIYLKVHPQVWDNFWQLIFGNFLQYKYCPKYLKKQR